MAKETFVLTSASGTAYDLTGWVNFTMLRGLKGQYQPDTDLLEDRTPQQPGSYLAATLVNARTLTIPLLYESTSRQGFIDLRRTLAAKLSPEQGAGFITYTDTNGVARKLNEVYVTGGLQGNTSEKISGVGWEKAILRVKALDPYWYATSLTSSSFTQTAASGTFLDNPWLPLKLADTALYGNKTINNPGDVTAYPYWHITGEFTSISLVNETTDKTLTLVYSLGDAEAITIDCRQRRSQTPNGKKVLYGSADLFQYLTKYDFWGLQPGDNVVRIEAENTGSGTSFEINFYAPYVSM